MSPASATAPADSPASAPRFVNVFEAAPTRRRFFWTAAIHCRFSFASKSQLAVLFTHRCNSEKKESGDESPQSKKNSADISDSADGQWGGMGNSGKKHFAFTKTT